MALLLAVSMPLTAFAVEADISQGDVRIGDTQVSHTTSEGAKTEDHGGSVTVIQSNPSTPTNHNVTIDTSSSVDVTLKDVNIDTSGTNLAAVEVTGSGNVTIELDGTNTVKSGDNHAGVEKNDGDSSGKLTITDDNETAGSLTATGGEGGAGIGGGYESSTSNITISGGTVTAVGGGAPLNDDGSAGQGGGAGIGGGTWGNGTNIKIEKDANVTATGKGNAADIGNGNGHPNDLGSDYENDPTKHQPNNVNTDGLYTTGSVTSGGKTINGDVTPPKDNDDNQSSGGGQSSSGSGSGGGQSSGGGSFVSFFGSNSSSSPSHKAWTDVAADLGKITASDNDGNALSTVVWLNEEDTLKVTAPANNVLVTGHKADLLQLNEDGVKQINLQTNRVNVSVTNELLQKITGTGGFQLTADGTTVSLSSTDGNNQKTPGLTLTANRQPEKGKLQVDFRSEESKEGAGDVRESLNKTLQVSTNAPEATLSYDQKYLQTLLANSELGSLALAVGNVIATMETQLAAITAQNGSGSISIGDNTVNMNGIQISANNSSGNSQLSQRIDEIMFQLRNQSQSGSSMMVTVNEKAAMASASLKVPGSALQSLMDQGVEKTALSVNGETTSFQNGDMLKQIQDSQKGSALVCLKPSAIGEIDAGVGMFDKGAITYQFAD